MGSESVLERLERAVADQRRYVDEWRRASAVLTLETVRAIDHVFCRELFRPATRERSEVRSIMTWGGNHALRRVLPTALETEPFRFLASSPTSQARADDFLVDCGSLQQGERWAAWLREGSLRGELRRHARDDGPGSFEVMILTSPGDLPADEDIGHAGLNWASSYATAVRRGQELRLRDRHLRLLRELELRVRVRDEWTIGYESTPEIDAYFSEWARLYLDRIYAQDLIGPDDRIGGRPFSRYFEVLCALSSRAHKHLAFTQILWAQRPDLQLRNLLTTWSTPDQLTRAVAAQLDGEEHEVREILACLTLSPENAEVHLGGVGTCRAPLVRPSQDAVLLPLYGLGINPFLFLSVDLEARFPRDWSVIANNRERRWTDELRPLFPAPRWCVSDRNLRLRHEGRDVTDVDFAVFDRKTGELALLQLKWQQPIASDIRRRRSAGRNLTHEGNNWVERVSGWIATHGAAELAARLGFPADPAPRVRLAVLGRYHAYFTGMGPRDPRAVWSDWAHFRRARLEGPRRSIGQTLDAVARAVAVSAARRIKVSSMIPVGDVGVILNPKLVPPTDRP